MNIQNHQMFTYRNCDIQVKEISELSSHKWLLSYGQGFCMGRARITRDILHTQSLFVLGLWRIQIGTKNTQFFFSLILSWHQQEHEIYTMNNWFNQGGIKIVVWKIQRFSTSPCPVLSNDHFLNINLCHLVYFRGYCTPDLIFEDFVHFLKK